MVAPVDPQLQRVIAKWTRTEEEAVEKLLLKLGRGRPDVILEKARDLATAVLELQWWSRCVLWFALCMALPSAVLILVLLMLIDAMVSSQADVGSNISYRAMICSEFLRCVSCSAQQQYQSLVLHLSLSDVSMAQSALTCIDLHGVLELCLSISAL